MTPKQPTHTSISICVICIMTVSKLITVNYDEENTLFKNDVNHPFPILTNFSPVLHFIKKPVTCFVICYFYTGPKWDIYKVTRNESFKDT